MLRARRPLPCDLETIAHAGAGASVMYEWNVPASYRMDPLLWHGCYGREEYFGGFIEFDLI